MIGNLNKYTPNPSLLIYLFICVKKKLFHLCVVGVLWVECHENIFEVFRMPTCREPESLNDRP